VPNLIGNVPDWDRIRAIADAHGLQVIEDSCDALGSTLRGTPTGTRSDISVTSFALSHIITAAGTGGMVCLDDVELVDRCLLLRRWGRRSELQIYGSQRGAGERFFSTIDGDIEYDNLFIFDELGWNFEPSELSAAFGLVQLESSRPIWRRASATSRGWRNCSDSGPTCSCCRAPPMRSTRRGTCFPCSCDPRRG
jgi:CDP-6-deoxy-D-xylo-4-hexulose-3-dehydrase